jgi:hypothetical protein
MGNEQSTHRHVIFSSQLRSRDNRLTDFGHAKRVLKRALAGRGTEPDIPARAKMPNTANRKPQ